jgi:hypothetical protein
MANLQDMTLSELEELKAQRDAKRYELINRSRDGLSNEELDALTRETNAAREEAAKVQFAIMRHSTHPAKYLPWFSGRAGADW